MTIQSVRIIQLKKEYTETLERMISSIPTPVGKLK